MQDIRLTCNDGVLFTFVNQALRQIQNMSHPYHICNYIGIQTIIVPIVQPSH